LALLALFFKIEIVGRFGENTSAPHCGERVFGLSFHDPMRHLTGDPSMRWQPSRRTEKRQESNLTTPARPTLPKAWLFGQYLRWSSGHGHLANIFAVPVWPKVRAENSR
jgi:hypothetical protein